MRMIGYYRWITLMLAVLSALGAGCTREMRKNRYLSRAERDFVVGRYEEATIEYQNAQALDPQDPAPISGLGKIYQAQGKFLRANAWLNRAIKMQPDNLGTLLKLGENNLALRRFSDARECAMKVLAKEPENGDAQLLLVAAVDTPLVLGQALKNLQALPQQLGGGAKYHVALGLAYLRMRDFQQADAELKHALGLDPKSCEAYEAVGNLQLALTNLSQADAAFKKAVELAPLRADAPIKYARLKLLMKANNDAKQILEVVTKKTPDYVPAWLLLAQICAAEHKEPGLKDSQAALDKLLFHEPYDFEGLLLSGDVAMESGDKNKALIRYGQILKNYPTLNGSAAANVYYKMGCVRLLSLDLGGASELFRKATTYDTNCADALIKLASLGLASGDAAQSMDSITRVINSLNQSLRTSTSAEQGRMDLDRLKEAYFVLAQGYLVQQRPDQAIAIYRKVAKDFARYRGVAREAHFRTGQVFKQERKFREAREAFSMAQEFDPGWIEGIAALVEVDLAEDKYDTAAERINQELARHPDVAEYYLIKGQIHWNQAQSLLRTELKNAKDQKVKLEVGDVPAALPEIDSAEKAFLKAIELKSELRSAYFFLGQLYVGSHKQKQALDRLEGFTAKTNDATAFMLMGMIRDQLKEYPAARDAYERVLKVDASSRTTSVGVRAAAMNNLAYLYSERLNDLDKGYDMGVKARDLQPYDPFAADTLGWILYQRGEFSRALALLEESRSALAQRPLQPENAEIMLHLGLTYYMLEQEAPARRALEQAQGATDDFPHKEQAAQKLAVLAIDPRSADAKVTARLEKMQQDSPNDPVVAGKLGEIQERDGAFDKAVKTYERCLKLNPQNTPLMFRAARLYAVELHDSARALPLAKAAHELSPNDPRISHLLGRLVFQVSDFVWASSLLEESVRNLPKETDILYDLAWSRYSIGRDADALATMRSFMQSTGSVGRAEEAKKFTSLVQAARTEPIPANAEAEAQKAVSTNASYVPGLMVLGLIQEKHGDKKQGAETYQRILNTYPNFAPALRNLALLSFEQGDERKAYQLASKAIESIPDDADLSKTLGVLAFRRGDYEQSERLLKSSLLKRNHDAELLFYLGKTQYKLNEQVGSKQSLLKALDLNLPPNLAEEARQILKGFK